MTEDLIGKSGAEKPAIEKVDDTSEGIDKLREIAYHECDAETALFLPGGKTPELFLRALAQDRRLIAGAVAMVDDRYSLDFVDSNEPMIRRTGLVDYFYTKKIPFYPVLEPHKSEVLTGTLEASFRLAVLNKLTRKETSRRYNERVGDLLKKFPKRVAILGLGEDGHIASLPAGAQGLAQITKFNSEKYVEDYDNFPIEPRERITLTPKALSKMDLVIVLVFGKAKKPALDFIFSKGRVEEVPGRILTRNGMAQRTIIITDQPIPSVARPGGKV